MNARQARWIDFLSEFDFDIKHIKGKENRVADVLSRKVNCIYEISFSEVHTTFKEHIKGATIRDVMASSKKSKQEITTTGI